MPDPIHEHFDQNPYPSTPLDRPLSLNGPTSFYYCITNAFYARDRKCFDSTRASILDAGCGTGYWTLHLAAANPNAMVLGTDWSDASIKVAIKRSELLGIKNVAFERCSVESLADLRRQFDYIHCSEVLYLLRDPVEGLRSMKSVLKPHGIIDADLHNARQRHAIYRAQELFKVLGVMSIPSNKAAANRVRELYDALHDRVLLKATTYRRHATDEYLLSNPLLRGDKGYSLQQVFKIINDADLSFIGMADANNWNLDALFMGGKCELEWINRLRQDREASFLICDLLNCNSRLYRFWCGHQMFGSEKRLGVPAPSSVVQLNPAIRHENARKAFMDCALKRRNLKIGNFVPYLGRERVVSAATVPLVIPLFNRSLALPEMISHWMKLNPLSPINLTPVDRDEAAAYVSREIDELERIGVVQFAG